MRSAFDIAARAGGNASEATAKAVRPAFQECRDVRAMALRLQPQSPRQIGLPARKCQCIPSNYYNDSTFCLHCCGIVTLPLESDQILNESGKTSCRVRVCQNVYR